MCKENNTNETLQTIQTRRSIRSYRPDPVPRELLDQVLAAGTYAATGLGKQSPIILAVTDPSLRRQLAALNAKVMGQEEGFDPFYGAPVVLIVLADKTIPTHLYDGSLVIGNLMLAAHSLGLGSCWIHRAKEEFETPWGKALLQSLGITGDYEGIGHCILGYPDLPAGQIPEAKPRKADYIHYLEEAVR